jgi:hypothetical protein
MAATAAFDCRELGPFTGHGFPASFTVKNDELLYAGIMVAIDGNTELLQASDTAGLQVVGVCQLTQDNADDGLTAVVRNGIFRYKNDGDNPLAKDDIGSIAFVHGTDAVTVCAYDGSTHKVAAGVVFDVESVDGTSYVWVDNTPCQIGLSGYRKGV